MKNVRFILNSLIIIGTLLPAPCMLAMQQQQQAQRADRVNPEEFLFAYNDALVRGDESMLEGDYRKDFYNYGKYILQNSSIGREERCQAVIGKANKLLAGKITIGHQRVPDISDCLQRAEARANSRSHLGSKLKNFVIAERQYVASGVYNADYAQRIAVLREFFNLAPSPDPLMALPAAAPAAPAPIAVPLVDQGLQRQAVAPALIVPGVVRNKISPEDRKRALVVTIDDVPVVKSAQPSSPKVKQNQVKKPESPAIRTSSSWFSWKVAAAVAAVAALGAWWFFKK